MGDLIGDENEFVVECRYREARFHGQREQWLTRSSISVLGPAREPECGRASRVLSAVPAAVKRSSLRERAAPQRQRPEPQATRPDKR